MIKFCWINDFRLLRHIGGSSNVYFRLERATSYNDVSKTFEKEDYSSNIESHLEHHSKSRNRLTNDLNGITTINLKENRLDDLPFFHRNYSFRRAMFERVTENPKTSLSP